KSAPFFLIIAGFAMSEMQGDILLAKAREISPDTRRILIADAAYIETMVSAINTARIHSCLTQPFEDRDLVNQVDQCRQQFKAELKKKALKQTIQRQNRQLFQIAGNFKKKQSADLAQVEARKKEIRILESRLKAGQVTGTADRIPGLNEIIDDKNTKYTAQGFGLDFQNVKSQVKEILETALFSQGLSPVSLSYQDVVFRSGLDRQYPGLVQKMLPPVRMLLHQSHEAGTNVFGIDFKRYMDAHFKLSFSDNRAKAFLKLTVKNPKLMNQTCIRYYLSWYKITYGIAPGTKIDAWLAVAAKAEDAGKTAPLVIAHGMDPVYPVDGEIRYHFPTDFLHAGKVDDDGSINFRDRGEIPFVKTNTFLAAKGDAETGKPGIDVTGKEIPVPEPVDRTFEAGPGTTLSQDGKKIYAACDGQPHLDATGKVSVCPEMKIEGDLGFETGDVIFDGNVVVSGVVKQGFKVKGASLTAREINGAEIDLTGDLNVSFGIVDTDLVNVKGSVQAKFIHNSKINAFGDLIVQREIIDSTIRLSGACINTSGNIINSEISANMGIEAGNIGTDTAEPSKLSVGKDEHTLRLVAGLDAKIRQNLEAAALLHKEITDLEKEDQELHGAIAHHATVQDRAELGLKTIKEKMAGLKASGNMAALQKVRKAVSQIEEDARNAEESINKGFERQDGIAREITQKKERITQFEDLNTGLEDDKKRLLEYTETKQPKAQVRVAKKIRSGTKILGPNTTLTLYNNDVRCRIVEMAVKGEDIGGLLYHEMKITSY
ncbi:MAG: FapA family protein, partial [Desulfobacterales bacterium]|nr:FapA family protein [Desulfobacterales bacterium]